jgi:hypothetical protein
MNLLRNNKVVLPVDYSYSDIARFCLYDEETDLDVLQDVLNDLYSSISHNVSTLSVSLISDFISNFFLVI